MQDPTDEERSQALSKKPKTEISLDFDKKIDALDDRIDELDKKLDELERKLEVLEP